MNVLEARRRMLGAGVYKKTVTGNPAIAQGSLARMYPGIEMQGWSKQDGTPTPENPVPIVSAGNWNEETQKWEYEIEVGGANLWDKEKASITDDWIESTSQLGYSDFAVDVLAGQKITVSFPEMLPTGLGYYVGIVLKENGPIISWIYHTTAESVITQKKTVISTENKIWIRCNLNGIEDFVSGNPQFQIEYGDKRTEFMSYLKRSVTLTSDRPLTKWDKLEKRNGQWGWVFKSNETVLDGSEQNVEGFVLRNETVAVYYVEISEKQKGSDNVIIDKMRYEYGAWGGTTGEYTFSGHPVSKLVYLAIPASEEGEGIKSWFTSNPLVLRYETAEETFVPPFC